MQGLFNHWIWRNQTHLLPECVPTRILQWQKFKETLRTAQANRCVYPVFAPLLTCPMEQTSSTPGNQYPFEIHPSDFDHQINMEHKNESRKDAGSDAMWGSPMGHLLHFPNNRSNVCLNRLMSWVSLPPCNAISPPSFILPDYVWMASLKMCNKTLICLP